MRLASRARPGWHLGRTRAKSTTLGYGDLVLPHKWRLLGPVEGLTGILMCGLSTGFFFAFFSRFLAAKSVSEQD